MGLSPDEAKRQAGRRMLMRRRRTVIGVVLLVIVGIVAIAMARGDDVLGPRVPMLIISPWAKQGYIDSTAYEFSSWSGSSRRSSASNA